MPRAADTNDTWQTQIPTTTGSDQTVRAAQAGRRNYLTDLILGNTSATATVAIVKDGASGRLQIPVPAGQTVVHRFATPLRGSVNSALAVTAGTPVTTLYINALGYTA